MSVIHKNFSVLFNAEKMALLTATLSFVSVAHAKDVELMDGVLEKAVVGIAELFVVLAGLVVYWLVFYPLKRWYDNKKLSSSIEKQQLTPLMLAAAKGDDAEVVKLVGQGCDVNAIGRSGETALMLAAKNDKRSTVRLLLAKGSNRNATTVKGNTARDIARMQGHSYVVDILADTQNSSDTKGL